MNIFDKLDEIGEYIQQAKVIPVLNQKILDVDYLMRSLEELYASVPAEIKEAKDFLEKIKAREENSIRDAENLMNRAKSECERMLTLAKSESQRLINDHEIKNLAEEQAKYIQSEVMAEVEQMRADALQEIEQIRKETLEKARNFEEKAYDKARLIKLNADKYAEEVLDHVDSMIGQLHSVSRSTRKFMAEHSEKDILEKANLN